MALGRVHDCARRADPFGQALAERNRLQMLEKEIAGRRIATEAAHLEFTTSQDAAASAHEFERGRRQSWRSAVAALDAARRSLQQQERESAARRQQMSAIEEAHRRLGESADEVRVRLGGKRAAIR